MTNVTISHLFDVYLTFTQLKNTKRTTQENIYMFNKHIEPNFGHLLTRDITLIDYQKHFNNLITSGLSPKTVKNIKTLLQAMYSIGIKNQLIEVNIPKNIIIPTFDNTRTFDYPLITQLNFLTAVSSYDEDPFNDIFYFIFHGRRKSEVLNITWDCINLNTGVYVLPFDKNKSRKKQTFKMNDELRSRLYVRYYKSELLGYDVKNGYVFINPNTETKYKDIRKAWKRFLDTNNLPKIRLHDVRHLIATYSINHLKQPIEHVSHTLGHSSITVTEKRYVTKSSETSKKVIDSIFGSLEVAQ